jgi:sulfur-oxidizing protein SoxY
MRRRYVLKLFAGAIAFVLLPINAVAAGLNQKWNKFAFEVTKLADASKGLSISAETPSKDIDLIAPDRAENGAIVQIEITSRIPNTEAISVLVEHNPTVLIGNFIFSNGALPYLVTRIKMAETSDIKIIVKAGDQYFTASKNVVVLENGCG